MAIGLTSDLVFMALVIGVISWIVCSIYLSPMLACIVAIIKVSIPLVYFCWFFDGKTWTFLDDHGYTSIATSLLEKGYNPLTILSQEGLRSLFSETGGIHVFYEWWCLFAQHLFGQYYYSAVFLNVFATFIAGGFLKQILKKASFSPYYQQACVLFFLFHFELLPWSSFVSLKDTLVMTLEIMGLYFLLELSTSFKLRFLLGFGVSAFLLSSIRFYIPYLMIMAFILIQLKKIRLKNIGIYILLFAACVAYVIRFKNLSDRLQPINMFHGFLKIFLSPIPWQIDEKYSMLFVPSILNWLFFTPSLFSIYAIWKKYSLSHLFIIFILMITIFYSAIPELAGARHRVQIIPILAWLQFYFIWQLLPKKTLLSKTDPSPKLQPHPT